jgi:hypothetical protein
VSDELDPVTQRFIADFADYVRPMQEAGDDTAEFAGTVKDAVDKLGELSGAAGDAGDSLDALDGEMDDASGSAEGFAEAEKSVRDELAETDHELHDQTESFFVWAGEVAAASAEAEAFREELDRTSGSGDDLYGTLKNLRDMLSDAELGDQFLLGKRGIDSYHLSMDDLDGVAKTYEVTERDLEDATRDGNEAFVLGRGAIDDYRNSLRDLDILIKGANIGQDLEKLTGLGGNDAPPPGWLAGLAAQAVNPQYWGALAAGIGLIAPAVTAIITEIGAVISGFAAASAGAIAFALLAIPSFRKVEDQLGPLKKEWDGLAKAFAPSAIAVFTQFFKDLGEFMPALLPQARDFAGAMDDLLGKLGGFVQSKGFQDWLRKADTYIGPATEAIGEGIGKILISIGKLMTTLSSKDVAHALNIFFDFISGTFNFIARVVRDDANGWDAWQIRITRIIHGAEDVLGTFNRAMDGVDNALAIMAGDARRRWDDIVHTVTQANHDIIGSIQDAVHDIAEDWDNGWEHLLLTAGRIMGGIVSTAAAGGRSLIAWTSGLLERVIGDWDGGWAKVVAFTRDIPGDILHALGDLGHLLVSAGRELIGGLIGGIENSIPGLNSIVGTVEGIVGKIAGLGGDVEHWLGVASSAPGGGGGGTVNAVNVHHNVSVDVAGIMTHPAYEQALQRHVQAAVLTAALGNTGSMLVLPGRRS